MKVLKVNVLRFELKSNLLQKPSWSLVLGAMLLFSSCNSGPNDTPDLGNVTGTVKLNNEPLSGANIEFRPTQGGRPSTGVTDVSGKYLLNYAPKKDGAKVGSHSVVITTFSYARPDVPEKLPEIYHEKTTLTADVKAGDNSIDFDLKGAAKGK